MDARSSGGGGRRLVFKPVAAPPRVVSVPVVVTDKPPPQQPQPPPSSRRTAPPAFARMLSKRFGAPAKAGGESDGESTEGDDGAAARQRVPLGQVGRSRTQKELHESLSGTPYCTECKVYLDSFGEAACFSGSVETRRARGLLSRFSERWAVLEGAHLALYSRSGDVGRRLPHAVLHLERCPVRDPRPSAPHFIVSAPDGDLLVRCVSADEKRSWLGALRERLVAAADGGAAGDGATTDPAGVAPPHSHFCDECARYLDLDLFTLGEVDGALHVPGGSGGGGGGGPAAGRPPRWWGVLARGHLALYASEARVTEYEPERVLHVGGRGGVSRAAAAGHDRLAFEVAGTALEAPSAAEYAAWLKALLQ